MKRWLIFLVLALAAVAFAATSLADPGEGKKKGHKLTAKGGKIEFDVTTQDHGCELRIWATDQIHRKYSVRKNEDGSYTIRREDKGKFTTTGPKSPSADPCPGATVIRRGKHGTALTAGITGKMHGYITGKATGGTFNPNGSCASPCTNVQFIAGFFSAGTQYTCNAGYAGCRFAFKYTAQRQNTQKLKYHHWEDRGTDGVHEIFIGDIATS